MKNKELLLKVLSLLRPYKLRLSLAITSLITVVACLLSMGWIIRNFVDTSLDPYSSSIKYLIVIIIIFGVASFLRSYLINSTAEFASNDAKKLAYFRMLTMSSQEIDDFSYSDLSTRINSDTEYIAKVVTDATSFFVRNIITTIGGIVFMFLNSVKLSLVAFCVISIITFIATRISKKIRALAKKTELAKSQTSNLVLESIINNKVITAFQMALPLENYFNKLNLEVIEQTSTRLRFRSFFFASVITSMLLTICTIIWYGGILIANNEISSGILSSFLFYSIMTATSFGGVIEMLSEFEKNLANCERVFEISPNNPKITQEIIDLNNAKNIELINLNYAYKTDHAINILSDFNAKISLSKFTVITGESGSGKTTILNLIMGIYKPQSGNIKIGTSNYDGIIPNSWNHRLAYVPQDNMLFSGSILDNITFFNTEYNIHKIDEILTGLKLDSFITSLKNGVNSEIGSLASKISGGQKQRLAIARALYTDPKILILDEATSQLDEETEYIILKFIKKYMEGKAIICVAHRRGAIEQADQVLNIK